MKSLSSFLFIFLIFTLVPLYTILNSFQSSLTTSENSVLNTQIITNKTGTGPKISTEKYITKDLQDNANDENHGYTEHDRKNSHEIVVAVVACGDRLAETLVMIKSAILFTRSPLSFIIMADNPLIPSIKKKLNEWKTTMNNSFTYEVRPVTFPVEENLEEWRRLFKPCSSQRLFLPSILNNVDSLLYFDADTLFLGPLEAVWRQFDLMNSSQMIAVAAEAEDPKGGWYNRFAKFPYYGQTGVNAGVMAINLTRMRAFNWSSYLEPVYKEYKSKIILGDQDIINIICHFHPEKLYMFPCRYNFRSDHCMDKAMCKSAETAGVAVLHGNRGNFHDKKHPAFSAIYRAMEEYKLGTDPYVNLLVKIRKYLKLTTSTKCGKIHHIYTKAMQPFIQELQDH